MTVSRLAALYRTAAEKFLPLEVLVELTSRCNFACSHCYWPDHDEGRQLPTDRLLRLLEELAEAGTLTLGFTGGEPTLRPDWYRIAARARRLGFLVHLLTNGSTLSETTIDQLSELHATVHVSVYALEDAPFATVTRRAGVVARILDGVRELRRRGVPVILKVPLLAETADHAPRIRELAAEIGAEFHADGTIFPRRDGDRTPLRLRLDPTHAAGLGAKLAPEGCTPLEMPDFDRHLCAAGTRQAFIGATGEVRPCPAFPEVAGSVLHRPFLEVWRSSPLLQKLRSLRVHDLEACHGCPSLTSCGRCPALALVEDGDLLGPSSWACARARAAEAISPAQDDRSVGQSAGQSVGARRVLTVRR